MKKQKTQTKVCLIKPVDFDFGKNKGKQITIKTTDYIQKGVLVALIDNMITLTSPSKLNFTVVSQIDYSEIQTIILN